MTTNDTFTDSLIHLQVKIDDAKLQVEERGFIRRPRMVAINKLATKLISSAPDQKTKFFLTTLYANAKSVLIPNCR